MGPTRPAACIFRLRLLDDPLPRHAGEIAAAMEVTMPGWQAASPSDTAD